MLIGWQGFTTLFRFKAGIENETQHVLKWKWTYILLFGRKLYGLGLRLGSGTEYYFKVDAGLIDQFSKYISIRNFEPEGNVKTSSSLVSSINVSTHCT